MDLSRLGAGSPGPSAPPTSRSPTLDRLRASASPRETDTAWAAMGALRGATGGVAALQAEIQELKGRIAELEAKNGESQSEIIRLNAIIRGFTSGTLRTR